MKRFLLCNTLFFCVFVSTIGIAYAEEEGGNGKDLLSGGLHKVESTAKGTTESTGDVVESAIEGAEKTVQKSASHTKSTVETLVSPSSEQPVPKTVNNTVELVEKTVNNVAPVADKVTETVHSATSEVTEIVDESPKVPVVTPILNEVSNDVGGTSEKVMDKLLETDLTPPSTKHQANGIDEQAMAPILDTYEDQPVDEMTYTIDPSQAIELEVNGDNRFISNEVSLGTSVNSVIHSNNNAATLADPESPMTPIQSGEHVDKFPIILTTGSTSIISPSVTYSGNADVMTGIVDMQAMQPNLSGRQWIHSDQRMRIQWIHAPPGQPPESSPFLHAKK